MLKQWGQEYEIPWLQKYAYVRQIYKKKKDIIHDFLAKQCTGWVIKNNYEGIKKWRWYIHWIRNLLHYYIHIIIIFKCIVKVDNIFMTSQSFQYLHFTLHIFNGYGKYHLPHIRMAENTSMNNLQTKEPYKVQAGKLLFLLIFKLK